MKIAEDIYFELCDKHIETLDRSDIVVMAMDEYASEQCQKRDELIKAQNELIKELCEEEGAVLYIKKLEDKIEELKKEIQ